MSYQSLVDIANQLVADLAKLESNELSIADLDVMHQNARELSERLTILKYRAIEKVVKPEKELSIKEEVSSTVPIEKKEEVKPTLKFNIRQEVKEAPQNQTNLLDEIKERVGEESTNLNTNLGVVVESKSLADRLKMQPIADLNSAIGMNEKFLFMNDLFLGERDAYHDSISALNAMSSFLEADDYINNNLVNRFSWDIETTSAVRFMELIQRRYLG